jgi:aminoglycoside phosphotransferase (APT) family kinase protein
MPTPAHDASLDGCFPELTGRISHVEAVDGGWDCAVKVLDGDLVARVPRRAEVEAALRIEVRLLEELAAVFPVRVPRPDVSCAIHGSMVYRRIVGSPLTERILDHVGEEVVAEQVAAVLSATWTFPSDHAQAVGVGRRDLGPLLARFQRRVLPLVGDPRPSGSSAGPAIVS